MEGRKQTSSSSSFTSDLFGSKESSLPSSAGIFGSIFAPPSKVAGNLPSRPEVGNKELDGVSQFGNSKPGAPDGALWNNEGKQHSNPSKDAGSYYQEQKVQPCHLSSSIYYGGQDVYSNPQNSQGPGYSTLNKDVGDDDSGSASRGNWWQGSLYY